MESLTDLAKQGQRQALEDAWMAMLESPETSPDQLLDAGEAIETLVSDSKEEFAETLSSIGIEMASARFGVKELLPAAGRWATAVKNSESLRQAVADLYRQAYEGVPGLDALMAEAGIEGGRPVRRAVRTLQVCLNIEEGSFLSARHESKVTRVESIDTTDWSVTIWGPKRTSELGPVELADGFAPVSSDDLHVLQTFDPDRLIKRLTDAPDEIVIDMLRTHGGKMTSDELEAALCPDIVKHDDWKKWWTKARTAVKRHQNVRIDGRSPYVLVYNDVGQSLEQEIADRISSEPDEIKQYGHVEDYLRECKSRGKAIDKEQLKLWRSIFAKRAQRKSTRRPAAALQSALIALAITESIHEPGADSPELEQARTVVDTLLKELKSPIQIVTQLGTVDLQIRAAQRLIVTREGGVVEVAKAVIPCAEPRVCEFLGKELVQQGVSGAELAPVISAAVEDPTDRLDMLLWLWNSPTVPKDTQLPDRLTILTRIITSLDDLRKRDDLKRTVVKDLSTRARAALSAKGYEGMEECIKTMSPEMASALHTQIGRLDNLGRTVHDRLLGILRRLKPVETTPTTPLWKREDVLLATKIGVLAKEAEAAELKNVKMKENAKAIGDAAAHGDLSENSEYKFALEERDLLSARLAEMTEQIAKSVLLQSVDVSTDHIEPGVRVRFKAVEGGGEFVLTILGPFEADMNKGIYNYKAPLCQALMGRKLGETVRLEVAEPAGDYTIDVIENAVADYKGKGESEGATRHAAENAHSH